MHEPPHRRYQLVTLFTLGTLMSGCAGDTSLYEGHRGPFPTDYKDKVRQLVDTRWPEPRSFRVEAISTPMDGFVLTTTTLPARYGAWLGCVRLKGDRRAGAGFDEMLAPYIIGSAGAMMVLEDEPNCHGVRLEPWPDMRDGTAT